MAKKSVRSEFRRKIFRKIDKSTCGFCQEKKEIDYKEVERLKRFVTERGKIFSRGRSGLCQKHQRRMAGAIKRARYLALLPFTVQPKF